MPLPDSNIIETCADCEGVPEFMPEHPFLSPAARHIAHGIEHGAWACDHVDFTADDTAQAYEALHALEMKRRDRAGFERDHYRDALVRLLAFARGNDYVLAIIHSALDGPASSQAADHA